MRITTIITGLLLALSAITALAASPKVLPPDQAFRISAQPGSQGQIQINWDIADGYFLLQNKFRLTSDTRGIALGIPQLPPAQTRKDPVFGDLAIYQGHLSVSVPVQRQADAPDVLTLKVRSQGCKLGDPCFPPHTQTLLVALDAAADLPPPVTGKVEDISAPGGTAAGSSELPSLTPASGEQAAGGNALAELSSLGASLGLDSGEEELLTPEQAYQFKATVKDGRTLALHWDIADGTYLYQDKIKLALKGQDVSLGQFQLPEAEIKHNAIKPDGTTGDVMVYHKQIDLDVPLLRGSTAATAVELTARFQGCAERGICYPPMKQLVKLDLPPVSSADDAAAVAAAQQAQPAAAAPTVSDTRGPVSEQDRIAQLLSGGNFLWIVISFFGIGVLLSLTPCVFPMIPILSGIIAGQGKDLSVRKGFMLSLVYVLAMAVTYTIAGVLVGLFGVNLSAALQQPGWLLAFAGIFVALALSMFGFYELQLPASLQSKLTDISNKQQGGSYAGVAVMGLLSALIVGPCLAPPLAGALIFISQSGDATLGGAALFAMGIGMGMPLLLIGASAGKVLPRAGAWMDAVKAVFGVLMLGVALTMLERLMPTYLPEMLILLAWGLLLIGSGIYMGAFEPLHSEAGGWTKLWKGLGLAAVIYGALFLVGAATGGKDTLQPLRGVLLGGGAEAGQAEHVSFKRIQTTADLDRELAAAKAAGKPVMLDFYADWCVYCKDMERKTFPDPTVASLMGQLVLLQVDVTRNTDEDKALEARVRITAPPAMIFWDRNGEELHNYRLVGFKGPTQFAEHLRGVLR
jgi:thiol:disulfide interchange protein DsbD